MADEIKEVAESSENSVMDWNDTIEDDGQSQNILLPEGDYNFIVHNFERGRFPGGPKIPACNKASITLAVTTEEGDAYIKFDLLLHRSVEWKISSFFRSIGQKKSGEKLVMDWNKVIASKGRAHIKQKTYTNSNGEVKTINDLDYFIDYNEEFFKDDLPF